MISLFSWPIFTGVTTITGAIASVAVAGFKRASRELKKANEELDARVRERTMELAATTDQLRDHIDKLMRAEQTIRVYADIFNGAQVGVSVLRLEDLNDSKTFKIVAANPAAKRHAGLPTPGDQLIGRNLAESLPQIYDTSLPEIYRKVILSGRARNLGEIRYDNGTSPKAVFRTQAFPLPDQCLGLIFENITERKKAQDLRALHDQEKAYRDFVDSISHELLTPLAAIQGFAETLSRGALEDPGERRGFVERIEHQAGEMTKLVETLLQLAVLESKAGNVKASAVRLLDFVQLVSRGIAALSAAKSIALDVRIAPEIEVRFDEEWLARILRNLLENAVKYSRPQGRIEVTARPWGDEIVVSIRDEGLGISPEDLPHIFERFYRTKIAKANNIDGMGLGLFFVKQMLGSCGCKIWAESVEGRGSSFFFTLPKQAPETPLEPSPAPESPLSTEP